MDFTQEEETKEMLQKVGKALRQIRKEKSLSLDELADATGVSKLTLGKIERGETNPTLGIVWKITNGLSIPLMALLAHNGNVTISRAGEGIKLEGENKAWVIEPISQYKAHGTVEMFRAYLQPHSTYTPELHHFGATESVTVMSGRLNIAVEQATYTLEQYDSIQFHAYDRHTYTNVTDQTAVLHMTMMYNIL